MILGVALVPSFTRLHQPPWPLLFSPTAVEEQSAPKMDPQDRSSPRTVSGSRGGPNLEGAVLKSIPEGRSSDLEDLHDNQPSNFDCETVHPQTDDDVGLNVESPLPACPPDPASCRLDPSTVALSEAAGQIQSQSTSSGAGLPDEDLSTDLSRAMGETSVFQNSASSREDEEFGSCALHPSVRGGPSSLPHTPQVSSAASQMSTDNSVTNFCQQPPAAPPRPASSMTVPDQESPRNGTRTEESPEPIHGNICRPPTDSVSQGVSADVHAVVHNDCHADAHNDVHNGGHADMHAGFRNDAGAFSHSTARMKRWFQPVTLESSFLNSCQDSNMNENMNGSEQGPPGPSPRASHFEKENASRSATPPPSASQKSEPGHLSGTRTGAAPPEDTRVSELISPGSSAAEGKAGGVSSAAEQTGAKSGSVISAAVGTGGGLKSTRSWECHGPPTNVLSDCRPFSVRHRIKSFESLASLDRPVSRSFALTFPSLHHKESACGGPNSTRSQEGGVLAPQTCSPLPNHAHIANNGSPDGPTAHTQAFLRRRHGRPPPGRLRQLQALSMPELDQLCTVTSRGGDAAVIPAKAGGTERPPPSVSLTKVIRIIHADPGSPVHAPPETTNSKDPGWSIRWGPLHPNLQLFNCNQIRLRCKIREVLCHRGSVRTRECMRSITPDGH